MIEPNLQYCFKNKSVTAWRALALTLKCQPTAENQLFYYLLPLSKQTYRPAIYTMYREDTLQLTSKTKAQ